MSTSAVERALRRRGVLPTSGFRADRSPGPGCVSACSATSHGSRTGDWQDPHPQLVVLDGTAYVSEPATSSLHAVDVTTGEVWRTAGLEVTPNELAGVPGEVDEHTTGEGGGHGEEGHGR